MPNQKIPSSLIGLLGPILGDSYTHTDLDSLFMYAGATGDPPEGNKTRKVQVWLRKTNTEHDEPLRVLGTVLSDVLDVPHRMDPPPDEWTAPRNRIRELLQQEGLTYQHGGRIYGSSLSEPSRTLEDEIRRRNIPAVEREFSRAYDFIEIDPPAAVTAACAILESVCKTYIEESGGELPTNQNLGPLWEATKVKTRTVRRKHC